MSDTIGASELGLQIVVDLASRFYIPRPPHEDEASAAVLQAGALIRIST